MNSVSTHTHQPDISFDGGDPTVGLVAVVVRRPHHHVVHAVAGQIARGGDGDAQPIVARGPDDRRRRHVRDRLDAGGGRGHHVDRAP